VTKADHEAKARDFVDSVLKANKQHGVGGAAGVIKYDDAVKAVAKTFKRLRQTDAAPPRKSPRKRHAQNPTSTVSDLIGEPASSGSARQHPHAGRDRGLVPHGEGNAPTPPEA
jgi:hypothetical protein